MSCPPVTKIFVPIKHLTGKTETVLSTFQPSRGFVVVIVVLDPPLQRHFIRIRKLWAIKMSFRNVYNAELIQFIIIGRRTKHKTETSS